jgi:hypothetical protein
MNQQFNHPKFVSSKLGRALSRHPPRTVRSAEMLWTERFEFSMFPSSPPSILILAKADPAALKRKLAAIVVSRQTGRGEARWTAPPTLRKTLLRPSVRCGRAGAHGSIPYRKKETRFIAAVLVLEGLSFFLFDLNERLRVRERASKLEWALWFSVSSLLRQLCHLRGDECGRHRWRTS